MKQDLCLLIQGDTRVITYMSQALGLMADLDLGMFYLNSALRKTVSYHLCRDRKSSLDGRHSIHTWLCERP